MLGGLALFFIKVGQQLKRGMPREELWRAPALGAMTATSLAIVGHLGQLIAIAVVVLIASGILIWASWRRRSRDDIE